MVEASKLKEAYENHLNAANALDDINIQISVVPTRVWLSETAAMIDLTRKRWEAKDGKIGFESVSAFYPKTQLDALESMVHATAYANTLLQLSPRAIAEGPEMRERATFLLGELTSAIDVVLDDGVVEEADRQAQSLRDEDNGDSYTALGQNLVSWAELGTGLVDRLVEIGDFDRAHIEEAHALGTKLLGLDAQDSEDTKTRKTRRTTRDKLRTLAEREVTTLQNKANRVFRDEPDTLRTYASAYRRRLNARAYRRRKARVAAANPTDDTIAES